MTSHRIVYVFPVIRNFLVDGHNEAFSKRGIQSNKRLASLIIKKTMDLTA